MPPLPQQVNLPIPQNTAGAPQTQSQAPLGASAPQSAPPSTMPPGSATPETDNLQKVGADPVVGILRPLQLAPEMKANIYRTYQGAKSQEDFIQAFRGLDAPPEVKASLYKLRFQPPISDLAGAQQAIQQSHQQFNPIHPMGPEGMQQFKAAMPGSTQRPFPQGLQTGLEMANKVAQAPVQMGQWLGNQVGNLAETMSSMQPQTPGSVTQERVPEQYRHAGSGAMRGMGSMVGETFGNPTNWPFLAGAEARPLIQKALSMGFAAQMGHGTLTQLQDLYQNWEKYSPDEISQKLTEAGFGAYFTKESAQHGFEGTLPMREKATQSGVRPGERQMATQPPMPQQTQPARTQLGPLQAAAAGTRGAPPERGAVGTSTAGQTQSRDVGGTSARARLTEALGKRPGAPGATNAPSPTIQPTPTAPAAPRPAEPIPGPTPTQASVGAARKPLPSAPAVGGLEARRSQQIEMGRKQLIDRKVDPVVMGQKLGLVYDGYAGGVHSFRDTVKGGGVSVSDAKFSEEALRQRAEEHRGAIKSEQLSPELQAKQQRAASELEPQARPQATATKTPRTSDQAREIVARGEPQMPKGGDKAKMSEHAKARDEFLASKAQLAREDAAKSVTQPQPKKHPLHQTLTRFLKTPGRTDEFYDALDSAKKENRPELAEEFTKRAEKADATVKHVREMQDVKDLDAYIREQLAAPRVPGMKVSQVFGGRHFGGEEGVKGRAKPKIVREHPQELTEFWNLIRGREMGQSKGRDEAGHRIKDLTVKHPDVAEGVKKAKSDLQKVLMDVRAAGGKYTDEQQERATNALSLITAATGKKQFAQKLGPVAEGPAGEPRAAGTAQTRAWFNAIMGRPRTSHFAKPSPAEFEARIDYLEREGKGSRLIAEELGKKTEAPKEVPQAPAKAPERAVEAAKPEAKKAEPKAEPVKEDLRGSRGKKGIAALSADHKIAAAARLIDSGVNPEQFGKLEPHQLEAAKEAVDIVKKAPFKEATLYRGLFASETKVGSGHNYLVGEKPSGVVKSAQSYVEKLRNLKEGDTIDLAVGPASKNLQTGKRFAEVSPSGKGVLLKLTGSQQHVPMGTEGIDLKEEEVLVRGKYRVTKVSNVGTTPQVFLESLGEKGVVEAPKAEAKKRTPDEEAELRDLRDIKAGMAGEVTPQQMAKVSDRIRELEGAPKPKEAPKPLAEKQLTVEEMDRRIKSLERSGKFPKTLERLKESYEKLTGQTRPAAAEDILQKEQLEQASKPRPKETLADRLKTERTQRTEPLEIRGEQIEHKEAGEKLAEYLERSQLEVPGLHDRVSQHAQDYIAHPIMEAIDRGELEAVDAQKRYGRALDIYREGIKRKDTSALAKAIQYAKEGKITPPKSSEKGFVGSPKPRKGLQAAMRQRAEEVREKEPSLLERLKATSDNFEKSRILDEGLQKMQFQREADKLRLQQGLRELQKLSTPQEQKKMYRAMEPRGEKFTQRQQIIYDHSIRDWADQAEADREWLGKHGHDVDNYVRRIAIRKNTMWDRIVRGKSSFSLGSALKKTASAMKGRSYFELTHPGMKDPIIAHVDDKGHVTLWENGKPEPIDMTRKQLEANGAKFGTAVTDEITKHAGQDYIQHLYLNTATSAIELRSARRATEFLEAYKASPEFKDVSVKAQPGDPTPDGYSFTKVPQLNGYAFEKHTAEVLDNYYEKLNKTDGSWLEDFNNFLTTTIYWNPLKHGRNVLDHWSTHHGLSTFLNPSQYRPMAKAMLRASRAVISGNTDYLHAWDSGMPLRSRMTSNSKLTKVMMDELRRGLKGPEGKAVAAAWGMHPAQMYKRMLDAQRKALFGFDDILRLQAVFHHAEMTGDSFQKSWREISKHLPDYTIPTHVGVKVPGTSISIPSRGLAKAFSSKALMFGRYHFGRLKSYGYMANDLLSKDVPTKERAKSIDRMLMVAVTMYAYSTLGKMVAQKLTQNKSAEMSPSGAAAIPWQIMRLIQGKTTLGRAFTSTFTPSPVLDFAGRMIYGQRGPAKPVGQQVKEAGKGLVEEIGPVREATRSGFDWKEAARRALLNVYTPSKKGGSGLRLSGPSGPPRLGKL